MMDSIEESEALRRSADILRQAAKELGYAS